MPLTIPSSVTIAASVRGGQDVERLQRSMGGVHRTGEQLRGLFRGLVPAVTVAGIVAAAKAAVQHADAIGDQAKMVGLTATAYQELSFAARQLEVDQGALDKALVRFRDRVGEARRGVKDAVKDFEALGLDPAKFKSTDDAFAQVTQRLGKMTDEFQRATLQANFFGRDAGPKLTEFVTTSADTVARLRRELHELGGVLSEDTIAKADGASKKFDVLATVTKTQLTTALVDLAPVLTGIGEALAFTAEKTNEFVKGWRLLLGSVDEPVWDPMREEIDAAANAVTRLENRVRAAQKTIEKRGQFRLFGGDRVADLERLEAELATARQKLAQLQQQALATIPSSRPTSSPTSRPPPSGLSDEQRRELARQAEALQREADEQSRTVVETELILIAERAEAQRELTRATQETATAQKELNAELNVFAEQAARNIQGITASLLKGELAGKDFGKAIINALRDIAAEIAAQQLLRSLFGSFTGNEGWLGAFARAVVGTQAHRGGVMGQDSLPQRSLSEAAFVGAPRLHGGLMPDEYPAILRRGEGVFTPGQMRALGGAGGARVTVNNYVDNRRATDPAEIAVAMEQNRQRTLSDVADLLNRNVLETRR